MTHFSFGVLRRIVHHSRLLIIATIVLSLPLVASAANSDPFRSGRDAVSPKQSAGVGQSTGAMTYSYPLTIPPGRNGVQPNLSLNYSSDDKRQDSIVGYGWSLNLPYIERVNKVGTNSLYNQDRDHTFFTSSLSGELLPVGTTTPIGGYFLGISQSTAPLPLLDTHEEAIPFDPGEGSLVVAEQHAFTPASDPMSVTDAVARSFHTFTDALTSAHVYHPNEWADWAAARILGARDARAPIPGFPVPDDHQSRSSVDIPSRLSPVLPTLPTSARANLKGEAIAALGPLARTRQAVFDVEILSLEPIDGGVQVFAKAWDEKGDAVGFGKDGSVEIERFRIFNPAILVDDPQGDIVRTMVDPRTGSTTERRLREDLRQSLLETLAHTITIVGKDGSHIETGKVGRTTDIYYPDAGNPGSTSVDETVQTSYIYSSWSSQVNNTCSSGCALYGNGGSNDVYWDQDTTPGNYRYLTRMFYHFNTALLDDTDTIDSATLSLYGVAKQDTMVVNPNIDVYSSTVSSGNTIATTDFPNVGATSYTGSPISYSSFSISTSTPNNFVFNATGRAAISKTGVSKFSVRNANFDVAGANPGGNTNAVVMFRVYSADDGGSGTTLDPKLVVEHTGGLPTPTDLLVDGLTNPTNIATTSPYFSAMHTNASSTSLASSYEIQIATTTSFSSTLYWDSGKKTLSSSTPPAQRSPNIYSTTTIPYDGSGTSYYWRIKFWDQYNGEGPWSTTTDYFTTQLGGDYMAKVDDGSMMRYTFNTDGSWVAYDKRGWKYTFGATSNARISDPTNSAKISRWYLEEVADPNGNKVLYRYQKDGGQVYPDYIDYTDRGGGSLYQVDFTASTTDASGSPTAPFATSSQYGFPVLTRYLVSDITVAANGIIVRRFTPTYKTGDNASRILLSAITERGYRDSDGGGATAFPPTTFTYQTSSTTWAEVTDQNAWQMTFDAADSSNNDYGWRLFDVNGDALPDWVKSDATSSAVLLNNGTKWDTSTAWTVPIAFAKSYLEQGVRMADVNGDGLSDLIAASSTKVVYINNGTTTWTASSTWAFPESITDAGHRDQGVQVVDLNGDGMADVLRSHYASTTGTTSAVYLNNGRGWTQDLGWSVPEVLINDLKDAAVRIYDYNGDGLPDMVFSPYPYASSSIRVYYSTGRGWQRDYTASTPFAFANNTALPVSSADKGVRFADFNGDGCVDIARGFDTDPREIRWTNCVTGTSTVAVLNTLPEYFRSATSTSADYGVSMSDVDGDGQIDIMRSYFDAGTGARTRKVYLKNGDVPDLLREVTSPRMGRTTVGYQGSAEYKSGGTLLNPNLPFVTQTVRTLATDNGSYLTTNRVIATTTYDYQRGYFYGTNTSVYDRKFAGFGLVVATSSNNAVTKTYFHQGNGGSDTANGEFSDHIAKAGRPYRTESYDQYGNLFARTINKWVRADYGDGRNFVKLAHTLVQVFDGDSSHRDTAASTTYNDTTGNVSVLVNYGEVSGNSDGTFTDLGTDLASTTYTYAASTTNRTMSIPSRELVADQSGNVVRDAKWTYDGLSFGSVTYGNKTKDERLIVGSTYASTTMTYDAWGSVSTSTDPLGNKTGFTYNSYHLYPTEVRNALGQTRLMSYDYSLGKAATTTDENNQTAVTVFDSLDRPIEEKQPDFITPSTLVLKASYTYTDATTTPSSVFRRSYLSSATSTDSYTYVDGFDRTIQTKSEAESANGWITKDTLYNSIGSVGSESLPYFTLAATYGAPTTTPALFVNYSYDAVGRPLTTANAVGTTTNTYSDWRTTITDALGNKKDLWKDAYGNLSNVVEYVTSASPATTTYTWNLNKKLTKITDASANLRNFTYDLLGRLTGSEDLHAAGDSTFGTSSRQYDRAGNLLQVYTPRGNAINYTYDALNRVLTENATTTASLTDVVYRYDTCTNGKGRPCEVAANNAATTTYAYNPIGLVTTEARKIGTVWATTTSSFFRTGAVDTLTYPTGHQIAYIYNDAGDLNRVRGLSPGTTTWSTLIESTTYGPQGKPLTVDYGNNTQTTYTYDPSQLYRLARKLTVATSTTAGVAEVLRFLAETMSTGDALPLDIASGSPMDLYDPDSLVPDPSAIPGIPPENIVIPEEAPVDSALSKEPSTDTQATSGTSADGSSGNLEEDLSPPTSLENIVPTVAPALTSRHPLSDVLPSLSVSARANLKGEAIAAIGPIARIRQAAFDVEILSMEPIDGGVQVFAKAWDEKGDAVGFGKDGSVEIERFRIFNPPILVDDPNGDIVRTMVDPRTGSTTERRLREDLRQSLLETLAHTITIVGKDGSHIETGKVGRTSDIYYPDAGNPGSVSVDETVQGPGTHMSWSSLISSSCSSGCALYGNGGTNDVYWDQGTTPGTYRYLTRMFYHFNTAAIADYDSIDSVTLSLYGVAKQDTMGVSPNIDVYSSTVSSDNAIATTSFPNVGATSYTGSPISYSSFSTSGYNDFTLNATGRAAISKTGVSKFSVRNANYDVTGTNPGGNANTVVMFRVYSADDNYGGAGTGRDPKLVVTHGETVPSYIATTTYQDLRYLYDSVGNITRIHDFSGTRSFASTSYEYDGLYRLTRASTTLATTTDWVETYTYDALGNLTNKSSLGSYTYAGTGYANPHAATTITPSAGSGPSTSTPAFVQSEFSVGTGEVTLGSPVTTGNLIVVGLTNCCDSIPTDAITDNKGNTYTYITQTNNGGDYGALFYAKNVTGGSSFTISSSFWGALSAVEYSGVSTSSPLDVYSSGTGSGTNLSSGTVTPSVAGELAVGLAWSMVDGDSWTAGSGYTIREQETNNATSERHAIEDKVLGTASPISATFSVPTSDEWLAVMATFKPLVTGGGGGGGARTLTYDTAGNLLSDGQSTYTWDPWNRLATTNTSGTTTSYSYDQGGQRITQGVKKGGGATTTTTYFSRLYEKTGATTTLYVFLPTGELLATIEGSGSATSTYIVHTDNINSSSVMTDKNGALAQQSAYYPFGAKRVSVLPASGFQEKRGFIGQYEDAASQLSYLQQRYYDATRGQFLSEDPLVKKLGLEIEAVQKLLLDPQMLNYYSYARNNPINYSDPNGEAATPPPSRSSFPTGLSGTFAWATASLSWASQTVTSLAASGVISSSGVQSQSGSGGASSAQTKGSSGSKAPLVIGGTSMALGGGTFIGAVSWPAVIMGTALAAGYIAYDIYFSKSGKDQSTSKGKPIDAPEGWRNAPQNPWESPGEDWEPKPGSIKDPNQRPYKDWYNPKTKENMHPDFDHPPPEGPHWDLKGPDGQFRIPPGGGVPTPKP